MAALAQPLDAVDQDEVPDSDFKTAVLTSLRQHPRQISPSYLYDEAGSQLFEAICELPEYYPTRTELEILAQHGSSIAGYIGARAELVEFGAGALRKVRLLLEELRQPRRYVPVDISGTHLLAQVERLRKEQPWLKIDPVVADFTRPYTLGPMASGAEQRVGLYFGSSIGNFDPAGAHAFLTMAAQALPGGALLVGIDLVKDPAVLHAAYNDAAGITADFNRNLLVRANRELGADFIPANFYHHATFNPSLQRIEMHLISKCRQVVHVGSEAFEFEEGESWHTENSHKFTLTGFARLAASAGWRVGPAWRDRNQWFALQWLYQDRLAIPGA